MVRPTKQNSLPKFDSAGSNTDCATAKPPSKIAQVLELLRRDGGATLAELVEATGWQPHTTRAALTGLRKRGHVVTKASRDDVTCYHVAR